MTRDEILGLSFLLEKDQLEVLDNFGIVQHKPYGEGDVITCTHPESLPDLADRLWRENIYGMTAEHHRTIAAQHFNNNRFTELQEYIWWFMEAKPIHRIQAALLAKGVSK
ncbi:MAG: hypothetical protein KBG19_07785 [Bacteroidales bacterium]|nr:hypothetical protein [Bacteroidales bacterium]